MTEKGSMKSGDMSLTRFVELARTVVDTLEPTALRALLVLVEEALERSRRQMLALSDVRGRIRGALADKGEAVPMRPSEGDRELKTLDRFLATRPVAHALDQDDLAVLMSIRFPEGGPTPTTGFYETVAFGLRGLHREDAP